MSCRGLRNLTDVQYEFQLAMTNRTVAGIETVFVMTSEGVRVRELHHGPRDRHAGGDVSKLVPLTIYRRLKSGSHAQRRRPRCARGQGLTAPPQVGKSLAWGAPHFV